MNPFRWLYNQLLGDVPDHRKPDDLVILAEPEDDAVAGIWRDQLEKHGIPSLLKDRNALNSMGMRMGQLWPRQYELSVRYRDLEAARQILGLESGEGEPEPRR